MTNEDFKTYQRAVIELAKLTKIEQIVKSAESGDPPMVFNALTMSTAVLGASSIGPVLATAMMLSQGEAMLSTAPPESAKEILDGVKMSHRLAGKIDEKGKIIARS